MADTIDDVAAEAAGQGPVEPAIDEQGVAEQLVAQAREKGIELVGPNGLLSQPTIVKKRQRRLTGVDQIVLSLSARGLTTGEISAHFAEVYGASVSRETVSKITDRVLEEMSAWMNRPLDEVYPVIFIDAIVVKVRNGQVRNKPIYVVIGVTVNGERDILGLWAGDGNEGAKFWLQILTELKNRGRCVHRRLRRTQRAARDDQQRLGADYRPGVHPAFDPQHLLLRLAEVLGPDRPRPAAGLHRRVRG